eukprot:TRINITY_DN2186_c0_g1_i1.p1 TRINITY_DN2186_c0_g1~~TRINITY_DN2186_c0_g1_i1.p1  ORF type:complete len:1354 (+),score=283.38 TRINITY_DN2186_c0_g1_i1:54-4115(+)
MNAIGRVMLVVLVLASTALCQDIEFWTSLPVTTAPDPSLVVNMRSFFLGAQLGFLSSSNPKTGVLKTHNVTLQILDDQGNTTIFQNNIQSILKKPNLLGILFSTSTSNANYIQSLSNNTVPFISPISSHSSLRTPSSRNIINLRPSNQAEVYGMLSALRNVYSVQRLAFFYETDDIDAEETLDKLRYYISILGLSLSSFANSSSDPKKLLDAVDEISAGNPSAVIIWSHSQSVILGFMRQISVRLPDSTLYAINYAGFIEASNYTQIGAETFLIFPPPLKSILSTAFLPFSPSQGVPVFNQFLYEVVAYYSGGIPPPDFYITASAYGFEGYFAARIISQILGSISSYPVTQAQFLKQFYKTPVFKVGGFLQGPISDIKENDSEAVFPVCNDLAHSLQLLNSTSGVEYSKAVQITAGSQVSWQPCLPSNNTLVPINFGTVYDPNDPEAVGTIQGLELAFSLLNKETGRAGLNPLQLIKLPISQTSDFLMTTRTLVSRFNITALACYTETAALAVQNDLINLTMPLVDVISGSSVFRNHSNPYLINVRVGIQEQVLNMMYYLLTINPMEKNQTINIGIYYQNDLSGTEFMSQITQVLSGFKTYTDKNISIPIPNDYDYIQKTRGSAANNNKLNIVFNLSSDQISPSGINNTFQKYPIIDYLLVNSRENSSYLISIITAINAAQPQANATYTVGSDGVTLNRYNHLQAIFSCPTSFFNITKTAQAANVSNVLFVSSFFSASVAAATPFNSILQYNKATATDSYFSANYNDYGLGGWVAGQILSSIVGDITGNITNSSFVSSLYTTSQYNVDGLLLGRYTLDSNVSETNGCTSGARNGIIVRTLLDAFNSALIVSTFYWSNCSADIPNLTIRSINPPSQSSSNETTTIVVTVVVVLSCAIFVCFCIVVAMVILYIVYVMNPKQIKKRELKEPRYELFVTKPIFYDRQSIDAMFIASTPTVSLGTKRKYLSGLEEFLLNPKTAYTILQALTKAGLARDEISAALMYIYYYNHQAHDMLSFGIQKEIVQALEESTLFREDSALAALWQAYIRLVGLPYLWNVCAETLYDIATVAGRNNKNNNDNEIKERRRRELKEIDTVFSATGYEVDKKRLDSEEDHYVNLLHLKLAAQCLFNKVRSVNLPPELRWFIKNIRKETQKKFADLTNGVLANFLFLRFICLGITTPNTFGLWKRQPTNQMLRFLVLLGKVVQNLAFGVEFEKEGYMTEMNDFIVSNRDAMNFWLEKVSSGSGVALGESSANRKEEEEKEKNEVEGREGMKESCLRWMYSQMYGHRQALKRECRKRSGKEEWSEMEEKMEELGILNGEESSDSTVRTKSGKKEGSSGENGSRSDGMDGEEL